MKILLLDGYFEPESTSFTHLETDLLQGFTAAGHEIYVVCPTPTRGIDRETADKYRKIKKEDLYDGKVHVRRFWAPQEKKNPIVRAFRYFWCNFREYAVAKKIKNVDLIFADSTPPTQGFVAAKLKKRKKIPFVYGLQDIFPDSLVNAGLSKEGSLLWKIGRKIENYTYRNADKIIVISEDFRKNLLAKGVAPEKIEVIYNWVDSKRVLPVAKDRNRLYDRLSLDRQKDFVVVYAGNFGRAQGVDVIFDAAKLLTAYPDIKFVLFGGGSEYEKMDAYRHELMLNNLILQPLLSSEWVPEVYSLGAVNLITCKRGFGNCAFPSKTWSIMACNSYIIASYDTDSELASVLKGAHAGEAVEPEDPQQLADAVLRIWREKPSSDGRAFLLQHADRSYSVGRYMEVCTKALRVEPERIAEEVLM